MARAKKPTRRGSPEAIAKRRAARSLNRMFDQGAVAQAMDGRTLKRKRRLLKELQEGKRGETLKAHEVLAHVTELLGMGENLTTIRRLKPRLPPSPGLTDDMVGVVRETQQSYSFDPRAWKLLGIDIESVMSGAGAAEASGRASKTGGGRKKSTRKKAS
jgi:hypothetical protein